MSDAPPHSVLSLHAWRRFALSWRGKASAHERIRALAPTVRKCTRTAAGGTRPRPRRHDGQLWYTPTAADKLGLWIGGEFGEWPETRVDDGG